MQINMRETGTFLFISDHCHVIENVSPALLAEDPSANPYQWRDGVPQGWLARDHPAWFRSNQFLRQLERSTRGQVIPGHDKETFLNLQSQAKVFL